MIKVDNRTEYQKTVGPRKYREEYDRLIAAGKNAEYARNMAANHAAVAVGASATEILAWVGA